MINIHTHIHINIHTHINIKNNKIMLRALFKGLEPYIITDNCKNILKRFYYLNMN